MQTVVTGDYAIIGIDLQIPASCDRPLVVFAVMDPSGNRVMTMSSSYTDSLPDLRHVDTVYCHIPFVPLTPGRYGLQFWIMQGGKLAAHYYEHPAVVPLEVCRSPARPDVPVDNKYGSTYAIRSWTTSAEVTMERDTYRRVAEELE